MISERTLKRRWEVAGQMSGWRVMDPGWWNTEEGPDFRDAVLTRGGRLLKGDVEIHRLTSDWCAHGHHHDPRYNRVVLHVVRRDDRPQGIVNAAGTLIPTLVLSKEARHPRLRPPPPSGRPALPAILHTLNRLGMQRFHSKIERLRRWAAAARGPSLMSDLEGALYLGLMDACGYKRNRRQFRALARRVPLARIRRLGAAPEIFAAFRAASDRLAWASAYTRPVNRPFTRLHAIAEVLAKARGRLGAAARAALRDPHARPAQRLCALFDCSEARAQLLAINVLYPWLALYGTVSGRVLWTAAARRWYREAPALPGNVVTRRVMRQVFGARFGARSERELRFRLTACQQQGLHALAAHRPACALF